MRSFSHMGNLYKKDALAAQERRRRRRSMQGEYKQEEGVGGAPTATAPSTPVRPSASLSASKGGFEGITSSLFSCVSYESREHLFSCAGENRDQTPKRPISSDINMLDLISTPER